MSARGSTPPFPQLEPPQHIGKSSFQFFYIKFVSIQAYVLTIVVRLHSVCVYLAVLEVMRIPTSSISTSFSEVNKKRRDT